MKKLLFIVIILAIGCNKQPVKTKTIKVNIPDSLVIEMYSKLERNSINKSAMMDGMKSVRKNLPEIIAFCQAPAFDEDFKDRLQYKIVRNPKNYLIIDPHTGIISFNSVHIKNLIEMCPFKLHVCVYDKAGNETCKSEVIEKERFYAILKLYERRMEE